jgi:hypothetical protein
VDANSVALQHFDDVQAHILKAKIDETARVKHYLINWIIDFNYVWDLLNQRRGFDINRISSFLDLVDKRLMTRQRAEPASSSPRAQCLNRSSASVNVLRQANLFADTTAGAIVQSIAHRDLNAVPFIAWIKFEACQFAHGYRTRKFLFC